MIAPAGFVPAGVFYGGEKMGKLWEVRV